MRLIVRATPSLCCQLLGSLLLALPVTAQRPTTLLHTIPAPFGTAQVGGNLGQRVGIDGDYTVVGVPYEDRTEQNEGVAKVFHSTTGALLHVLRNSTPPGHAYFGSDVAISGTRVAVTVGSYSAGNRVYLYDLKVGTEAVVIPTDAYGSSVALSGTRLIVGAYQAKTGPPGRVYVYDLSAANPTTPKLTVDSRDFDPSYSFGSSVSISGARVVVGAPEHGQGRVYHFDLESSTPTLPVTTLDNPSPGGDPRFGFGHSVTISETRIVVGTPNYDTGTADVGRAYVYDLTTPTPTTPTTTLNNPTPTGSSR